ncbi:MAG: hypothetical protein Q8N57_04060 [bacterium]|nr:hypothetical protein [bacterium]
MNTNEFAFSDLTAGQLNAVVKKLGGYEATLKFLRGELIVSEPGRLWREADGVIYFSVTSDGTTGPQWIKRLGKKGFRVGDRVRNVLRSNDFKPTSGIITEIAVLKGMLFEDNNRITENIRAEVEKRKFTTPNAEIACLIREMFTDEELETMGLYWIVAMHEPINDSNGGPSLLRVSRNGDGRRLNTYYDEPGSRWGRGVGFASVVSQVVLKA